MCLLLSARVEAATLYYTILISFQICTGSTCTLFLEHSDISQDLMSFQHLTIYILLHNPPLRTVFHNSGLVNHIHVFFELK